MFIVRWLMSHPILFAWALAALAIILNWGTKSGVDHAEPKNEVAVHSQQATEENDAGGEKESVDKQAAQQVAVGAHAPKSPEQPIVPEAPVKALEKPEKPGMDAVKVAPSESQGQDDTITAVTNADSAVAVAKVKTQEISNDASKTANTSTEVDVAAESQKVPAAAASVVTNAVAATPDALLKAAREAFWHNNKDEAATIYKQLIEMQPDVLEHKGELGNVYWHQNKQKESAALYAEIAIPLIKKGKSGQVENMLGFIGAFYPEKAAEIHQYLLTNQ